MIAMLEMQHKKWEKRVLRAVVANGDHHVTVEYNRGKKLPPLLFSYCPFCGVQFKKIISPGAKSKTVK